MIISDLSHLEPISEFTDILGGAGTAVSTAGVATGEKTYTNATAYTTANSLYALGLGSAEAIGSGGKNPTATTTASGVAEGTLLDIVIPVTVSYKIGSTAVSRSFVLALGVDHP
ncbi:hypothetical protein SD80_027255 [Scytonema tolypothrichoides VB-61278]|nr:hypothetical protein SD80_027255 [Scytonema tolypothrichoides VB-61278]